MRPNHGRDQPGRVGIQLSTGDDVLDRIADEMKLESGILERAERFTKGSDDTKVDLTIRRSELYDDRPGPAIGRDQVASP